jgi:hypothetical protein
MKQGLYRVSDERDEQECWRLLIAPIIRQCNDGCGIISPLISASLFSEAYIGLGEKDEAMEWLERAYEEHDQ